MQLRWLHSWTWLKALAVLGVLMHAGLTVRHAVRADVAIVICHGDGSAPTVSRLPMPDDPAGTLQGTCPICAGAVAGAAVLPPVAFGRITGRIAMLSDGCERQHMVLLRAEVPAPGRGPPVARA